MSYAPEATESDFVADPRRVLLGFILSPLVPSLAVQILGFEFQSVWPLLFFGLLSVATMFLPWVLWKLPRTRRPFLTCVLIGGFSAPGLLGYMVAIMAIPFMGDAFAVLGILIGTFPLGAIGGAVFWLCAVWRSEGWD